MSSQPANGSEAPDTFDAWFHRGIARMAEASLDEALASFDRALALNPGSADALNKRGNAHRALGRLQEALADYERALAVAPAHSAARFNLGILLMQLNRPSDALAAFDKIVADAADDAEGWNERGNALAALDRKPEALESYDRALALHPSFAAAHYHRGLVLRAMKRPGDALASFDAALALDPTSATALQGRGLVLEDLKRYPEAFAAYDAALRGEPDNAAALSRRALMLHELDRPAEALPDIDRAVAMDPNDGIHHLIRGIVLGGLHRHPESLRAYDRALELIPGHGVALNNRAAALRELGRHREAIAAYHEVLAIDPEVAEARFNLGICHLQLGEFADGWRDYEWRWSAKAIEGRRQFDQPLWLGETSLAGKAILLHAEQGIGDVLQFCRYAPIVALQASAVHLQVRESVLTLLRCLPGVSSVIADGAVLPQFDVHCPLLSLPLALGTRLESIPADTPYLRAEAGRASTWRERLGPASRPRVGLVWSGNPGHKNDHNRSIPLDRWDALLDARADFVSVQKDVRRTDAAALALRPRIRHFGDEIEDFADTAALIEVLDLVISVDTSVAHLAGALGKPIWILLPFNPDFRWMLERTDSPWYPTARLFRQPRIGDWAPVFVEVAHALRAWVTAWQNGAKVGG